MILDFERPFGFEFGPGPLSTNFLFESRSYLSDFVLRSGSLPSTISLIGKYAFDGCNKLTGALEIPDYNYLNIGEGAFRNCYIFKGPLIIHNNIVKIMKEIFKGYKGLTGPLNLH